MNTKRRTQADDDNDDSDSVQLKLYFNQQTGQVAGFGWMNEYKFCYGSFNAQAGGEVIVKRKGIELISYLKKESDSPVENELPLSFALTQFHIIFMYPKNITVLSKISNEIVFFRNFDT